MSLCSPWISGAHEQCAAALPCPQPSQLTTPRPPPSPACIQVWAGPEDQAPRALLDTAGVCPVRAQGGGPWRAPCSSSTHPRRWPTGHTLLLPWLQQQPACSKVPQPSPRAAATPVCTPAAPCAAGCTRVHPERPPLHRRPCWGSCRRPGRCRPGPGRTPRGTRQGQRQQRVGRGATSPRRG
jgi:hypothetical protein